MQGAALAAGPDLTLDLFLTADAGLDLAVDHGHLLLQGADALIVPGQLDPSLGDFAVQALDGPADHLDVLGAAGIVLLHFRLQSGQLGLLLSHGFPQAFFIFERASRIVLQAFKNAVALGHALFGGLQVLADFPVLLLHAVQAQLGLFGGLFQGLIGLKGLAVGGLDLEFFAVLPFHLGFQLFDLGLFKQGRLLAALGVSPHDGAAGVKDFALQGHHRIFAEQGFLDGPPGVKIGGHHNAAQQALDDPLKPGAVLYQLGGDALKAR